MAMNLEGNLDLERKFWLRKWMAPQILESGIELACVPSPPKSLTGSKNTVCSLGGQGRGIGSVPWWGREEMKVGTPSRAGGCMGWHESDLTQPSPTYRECILGSYSDRLKA